MVAFLLLGASPPPTPGGPPWNMVQAIGAITGLLLALGGLFTPIVGIFKYLANIMTELGSLRSEGAAKDRKIDTLQRELQGVKSALADNTQKTVDGLKINKQAVEVARDNHEVLQQIVSRSSDAITTPSATYSESLIVSFPKPPSHGS